jgi:hypothetical protein
MSASTSFSDAEPVSTDSASSLNPQLDGKVRVTEPDFVILGELVGCLRCLACLDGYLRIPASGFCPDCGTHIKTLKKQQALHAILARRYDIVEVS